MQILMNILVQKLVNVIIKREQNKLDKYERKFTLENIATSTYSCHLIKDLNALNSTMSYKSY